MAQEGQVRGVGPVQALFTEHARALVGLGLEQRGLELRAGRAKRFGSSGLAHRSVALDERIGRGVMVTGQRRLAGVVVGGSEKYLTSFSIPPETQSRPGFFLFNPSAGRRCCWAAWWARRWEGDGWASRREAFLR